MIARVRSEQLILISLGPSHSPRSRLSPASPGPSSSSFSYRPSQAMSACAGPPETPRSLISSCRLAASIRLRYCSRAEGSKLFMVLHDSVSVHHTGKQTQSQQRYCTSRGDTKPAPDMPNTSALNTAFVLTPHSASGRLSRLLVRYSWQA